MNPFTPSLLSELPFIKLYRHLENDGCVYKELNESARKLYLYITQAIQIGEDTIELCKPVVCDIVEITESQYSEAIIELHEIELISTKEKNVYWVNPMYIQA